MPSLLIVTPEAEEFRTYIATDAPDLDIQIAPPDDLITAQALMREIDFMLAWKFPSELLTESPRLRWIMSFGAGVDHLMSAGVPEHVAITRVVDAFGPAMAEYVLGFCYAAALDLRRLVEQQRRGEWKPYRADLLRGRIAVVIGLGSIGREVCRLLRAAGLRVLGVSRSGNPVAEAERTYKVTQLEQALPQANYLVIVAPLTPETRGLIGARQLALLPAGAWLINVARGPITVETDLLAALRQGTLAGAALDVFDREPLPPEHPFWTMDNVYVTPHMSGPDENSLVAEQFVENYRRLQAGLPLLGMVDRSRGY